jgi:flagellar protein FlgJ
MRATDATFRRQLRQRVPASAGRRGPLHRQGGGSAAALSPQGRAYLEQSQPVKRAGRISQGGEIGEAQQQFLASIKPWAEETGARWAWRRKSWPPTRRWNRAGASARCARARRRHQ